ncbi:MAG: imidazole glycerol phosphate synthase subunit HisH [Gammaproteobacteria bacterium]|nr:imidazole glycerol phosphate synthase subunit HisH [Gammaproteobacteria bacterium]
MSRVAVIDYGGSNLRSVAKAIEFAARGAHQVIITDVAAEILAADRVVFPGQGAIGDCMARLNALALVPVLRECIRTRPFLGICLGLQSLMEFSDENGGTPCLSIYPGRVRRFRDDAGPAADGTPRKIPHMGWNEVHWAKDHPLVAGIPSGARFYFVHSYYVVPENERIVMGRTNYIDTFVSALADGHVFATQFHPEKSAQAGLKLLENFLGWDGK